jgi:hypothetical protein
MKITPINVLLIQKHKMQEGTYVGTYCGYVVEIPQGDRTIEIRTSNSVRGQVPCSVTVDANGEIDLTY